MFALALIHESTWSQHGRLLRPRGTFDAVIWRCGKHSPSCGTYHVAATSACARELCTLEVFRKNREEGGYVRLDFFGKDIDELRAHIALAGNCALDDSRLQRPYWHLLLK